MCRDSDGLFLHDAQGAGPDAYGLPVAIRRGFEAKLLEIADLKENREATFSKQVALSGGLFAGVHLNPSGGV